MKKEKDRKYAVKEVNLGRFTPPSPPANEYAYDNFEDAFNKFLELHDKHGKPLINAWARFEDKKEKNCVELVEDRHRTLMAASRDRGYTIDYLEYTVIDSAEGIDYYGDVESSEILLKVTVAKSRPLTDKELESRRITAENRNRKAELDKAKQITKLEKELKRLKK